MSKFREWLIRKILPKDLAAFIYPTEWLHDDEKPGREYVEFEDGLRLYFENDEYVGFSTQEPYIGKSKKDAKEPG